MTRHSEFKMESRRYGGGYTNFVQIVCGWCNYEAWFPAKNGGWAMRIFRAHGWKVGSKDAQHRCPKCFGKAMAAGRRSPDNPVIPKELGKAIKIAMKENHVREALLGSTVLTRDPPPPPPPPITELTDQAAARLREKPAQDPLYVADVIVPATGPEPPTAAPEPEPEYLRPIRGTFSVPGRTQWRSDKRGQAASSGTRSTGSVDGVGFFTVPLGKGWTWKHAKDVTPEEQIEWLASRAYGPTPRARKADSKFGPKPEIGATITTHLTREDGRVSVVTVPLGFKTATPEEEPQMTAQVTPIRKDTMPTPDPLKIASDIVSHVGVADPVPPRQPTRDERTTIHDELTKVYDPVDQRYGGADTDKTVAARLDMPRAWVTEVRTMFFGDHDRNAASEKQKLKLGEAIAMAKAATTVLLEMASKAETLERDLTAALKLLED